MALSHRLGSVLKRVGQQIFPRVTHWQNIAFLLQLEFHLTRQSLDTARHHISRDTQTFVVGIVLHLLQFIHRLVISQALIEPAEPKPSDRSDYDEAASQKLHFSLVHKT